MQVVIALFCENADWISEIPNHWDVVVYNKSDKSANIIGSEFMLPNIGRESQSFFYHIYKNYDNLHDLTLFLQGFPFDHTPDIKKILNLTNLKEMSRYADKNLQSSDYIGFGPFWEEDTFIISKENYWKRKGCEEIWNMVHPEPMPNFISTMWGQQFIISKRLIQRFPISFYQKISDKHHYSPMLPYKLEFMLPAIYLQESKRLSYLH